VNAPGGGLLGPTENTVSKFAQQLEAAERDSAVKAVVLRVNSPGGTVSASDTMYQLVRRFREKTGKPVVASTQEVAASGGYYVACAADTIVAQPTSVVGSIGVIFEAVQFKGALDKLGVSATAIKSGSLKDIGSPWKLLRDDEKEIMQQLVDEYFARFVDVVKTHRPATEARAPDLNEYKKKGIQPGVVPAGGCSAGPGRGRAGAGRPDAGCCPTRSTRPGRGESSKRRPCVTPCRYGVGGSIYASTAARAPKADGAPARLAGTGRACCPAGFYYLWRP
jgi:signal peptide peptidase SppA